MFRSIIAILAGFVVVLVLSLGADALMYAAFPRAFNHQGMTSQPGLLALALIYTTAFAVLGSYVAARLAGRLPLLHALILGMIGFALGVAATASAWQTAPGWYHVCALAIPLPAAWLGGTLRARQTPTRTGMPRESR